MFVLLLSVIIFLSITLSRTTDNNNTLLKNQLHQSVSHINDMLADIEGKIEDERKILSQIDYDLNQDETGFMDYEVTDIWWHTSQTPAPTQTTQQETTVSTTTGAASRSMLSISLDTPTEQNDTNEAKLAEDNDHTLSLSEIVSNWANSVNLDDGDIRTLTAATRIIPTTTSSVATTLTVTESTVSTTLTSPIIPKVLPTLPSSIPADWPFPTSPDTTDTPFIKDLKKVMEQDRFGYYVSFLTKFLEMLSTKDLENVTPIIRATTTEVRAMIQSGKLKGLSGPLENNVKLIIDMVNMMSPPTLQQQAGVGHYVLKNKHILLSKEANTALDQYDSLFTKQEGEALFASLELFDKYPDGGKSATEVTQSMLNAVVAPMNRIDGTLEHQKLVRNINQAIQEMYPNWRTHDQVSISNIDSNVDDHFSQGKNNSIVPLRRSMNYKKIMRHFLLKHPKLFKKIKHGRHKHIRKMNHHRMIHEKRRHNFHKRHIKHGHLYEQLLKKRTYTISSNEHENITDSSASEAFYHDPSIGKKRYRKKMKQKLRRLKTNNNHLHARHRNNKLVQQQQQLYKPRAHIAHKKRLNAKYLRELAIKFIRKKQNGKTFRRLNIESSENEILNETVKLPLVDNNILHKITEASSYSDEENNIKTNLYDALRHGNSTYYQFRSNDAYNQTLWDVSTESDDEWIIKNNIYKVFE